MPALVVARHAHTRDATAGCLRALGFEAQTAENTAQALVAAAVLTPTLALIDQSIGINAAAELAAELGMNGTRTCFWVGYTGTHAPLISDAGPIVDSVSKPVVLSALQGQLNHVWLDPLASSAPAQTDDGQPLLGLRLLLAEDSELLREVGMEILGHLGATVTTVSHGLAAVETALASPQGFDAVLMDIQMPELDGIGATEAIRRHHPNPHLPIIAMTAHAMASERDRCLAVGMNEHISKPIDPDRLVAVLKRLMDTLPPAQGAMAGNPTAAPLADDAIGPIVGMDVDAALARMGGKQKLLRKSLVRFYEGFRNADSQIRTLRTAGDTDALARLLHTLKGIAATLSADALCTQCIQFETDWPQMSDAQFAARWQRWQRHFTP
jgi:hypothetical protein